jgi:uncharacterized membrane protein YdjX (TVP38/TMEM64 family)
LDWCDQLAKLFSKETFKLWWRPGLFVLFLISVVATGFYFNIAGRLEEIQEWIRQLGWMGYVMFVLIHVASMIAVTPRSVLAVAAGLIFGPVAGVILVTISSISGASVTFLLARYLARDTVERWFSKHKHLEHFYHMAETRGAMMIAITRVVPILPATVLNYGFGLTKIRFSRYFLWSLLCMIPGTLIYVLGANIITKIALDTAIPMWLVAILAAALIICGVCIITMRKFVLRMN